jgi:hypothetical protein
MNKIEEYKSPNSVGKFHHTSGVYEFIPTTTIVRMMGEGGWKPYWVRETRTVVRDGFQKHLIRFRKENFELVRGEILPEILVGNSHDGTSSFFIKAGLFRTVCENGLVVIDSEWSSFRIPHLGFGLEKAKEAVGMIIDGFPRVLKWIKKFKELNMEKGEVSEFGTRAIVMKYGKDKTEYYDVKSLVQPRRLEDEVPTLWNVYNRIQEGMVKGGKFRFGRKGELIKTRPITEIKENMRVNQELWGMAEDFYHEREAA